MRDTITDLATDLAAAHPVLACLRLDAKGWATFLATLAVAPATDLDVVCAMLRPDLASRVRVFVAGTVSGEVQRGTSAKVASSTAVTFDADAGQRVAPASTGGRNWGERHAATLRPFAMGSESP
jgi:hypothetical protein